MQAVRVVASFMSHCQLTTQRNMWPASALVRLMITILEHNVVKDILGQAHIIAGFVKQVRYLYEYEFIALQLYVSTLNTRFFYLHNSGDYSLSYINLSNLSKIWC